MSLLSSSLNDHMAVDMWELESLSRFPIYQSHFIVEWSYTLEAHVFKAGLLLKNGLPYLLDCLTPPMIKL